jgi:hypothetical protein
MDWPTIATSAFTAMIVAFLGPQFQHRVWRGQKLREQRMAVAERLARIGYSLPVFLHSSAGPPLEVASLYLDQFAILVLIQVLFNERRTLEAGRALKIALDEAAPDTATEEHIDRLQALRVDLLACMFAEAFGVSMDRLVQRPNH